jgi:hypothetical protein
MTPVASRPAFAAYAFRRKLIHALSLPIPGFQAVPMMKLSRLLYAGLALTLVAGLATPASAITTYDGTYRVDVTTEEGDCQRTASGTVTVSDGIIVATSDSAVQAFGRVGADGVASFQFRRGQDIAHVSGRLKGASGSGSWSVSTQLCGGVWRAQKMR